MTNIPKLKFDTTIRSRDRYSPRPEEKSVPQPLAEVAAARIHAGIRGMQVRRDAAQTRNDLQETTRLQANLRGMISSSPEPTTSISLSDLPDELLKIIFDELIKGNSLNLFFTKKQFHDYYLSHPSKMLMQQAIKENISLNAINKAKDNDTDPNFKYRDLLKFRPYFFHLITTLEDKTDAQSILEKFPWLSNDKPAVLAAVGKHGAALLHASETLKGDKEVCLAAVATYPDALGWAKVDFDEEFALKAVEINGDALRCLTMFQSNSNIVKAAVKQTQGALIHANATLKNDPNFVCEALKYRDKPMDNLIDILNQPYPFNIHRVAAIIAIRNQFEASQCSNHSNSFPIDCIRSAIAISLQTQPPQYESAIHEYAISEALMINSADLIKKLASSSPLNRNHLRLKDFIKPLADQLSYIDSNFSFDKQNLLSSILDALIALSDDNDKELFGLVIQQLMTLYLKNIGSNIEYKIKQLLQKFPTDKLEAKLRDFTPYDQQIDRSQLDQSTQLIRGALYEKRRSVEAEAFLYTLNYDSASGE